ncbi:hypothetical protein EYC51_03450 [Alcaligenes faecalis]|nr:hypothetical protein EYC51_03450 [Alcaligenes faecalis]
MKVKAIFSFDHDGARRRGDEFEVSDRVGHQLINKGLARLPETVAAVPALSVVQAGEDAAVALLPVSGVADGPVAQAQAGEMPGADEAANVVATVLFQDDVAPGTGAGRKARRVSAPVEGAEPK